jgi:hypothetical protein
MRGKQHRQPVTGYSPGDGQQFIPPIILRKDTMHKLLSFLIVLASMAFGVGSLASAQTNFIGGGIWGDAKVSGGGATIACAYTPVTTGTEGTSYTGATPSASGGAPAYTFSETGSLPTGLSISSSTGIISGTPSVSGSFPSIQVKVTDTASNTANCGAAFTLVISPSGFSPTFDQAAPIGVNFFGTSQSVSLTTAHSNELIVVDVLVNTNTITSVVDSGSAGLTFAKHGSVTTGSGTQDIERWFAIAPSSLTAESITVNVGGLGTLIAVVAYGISGVNTASPFQGTSATSENSAGGVDPLSGSATSAPTIAIAALGNPDSSGPTHGSGWTNIFDNTVESVGFCVEYQPQASAGSVSATLSVGTGTATTGLLDIVQ